MHQNACAHVCTRYVLAYVYNKLEYIYILNSFAIHTNRIIYRHISNIYAHTGCLFRSIEFRKGITLKQTAKTHVFDNETTFKIHEILISKLVFHVLNLQSTS